VREGAGRAKGCRALEQLASSDLHRNAPP
jgi:hypothetical protein